MSRKKSLEKKQLVFDIERTCWRVELSQGLFALVDETDLEKVVKLNWHALADEHTHYAIAHVRTGGRYVRSWKMHRYLLEIDSPKLIIDHVNGNGLDNRRCGLRTCTNAENLRNRRVSSNSRSRLKGAYWCEQGQRWRSSVLEDGKQKHLGYFDTPEEAHAAYCAEAQKLHGDFFRKC